MSKTYTPHDLIRFLYKETNEQEEADIAALILSDEATQKLYLELLEATFYLDSLLIMPPQEVIANLLQKIQQYIADLPKLND